MTSVEIPYSIACVLPSLVVVDITNEVAHAVEADATSGIAYVTAGGHGVVRVNERESGFFADVEGLLERLVPIDAAARGRHISLLLGARSEPVPFADGRLCLGRWQRILLIGFDGERVPDWHLTLVG
jgi:thiamine phosphate synthase YjbQ (UPF0047 family)